MYYSGKNLLSVSNVSFAVNPQRMVLSASIAALRFPVIGAVGNIGDVVSQLNQYLICIFHFLWREKSVVENPVILFPMLVIVPEEIDG